MKSIKWKLIGMVVIVLIILICSGLYFLNNIVNKTLDISLNLLDEQLYSKEEIVKNIINAKVDNIKKSSILVAEQIANNPEVIEGIKNNDPQLIHNTLEETAKIAEEKANIDLIWVTRLADRTNDKRTPILACPSNKEFDGYDGLNYSSTNQALDTKETVASWEVNEEDGKLQVTVPVFDAGNVIGAVVVGQQTYQGLLKEIIDASGTAATLFLKANDSDYYIMTDGQTDDIGQLFFQYSHERDIQTAPNLTELAKEEEVFNTLLPLINNAHDEDNSLTEIINLQGTSYVLNFKPLHDNSGNTVGVLMSRFPGYLASKQEIYDQTSSIKNSLFLTLTIIFLISLVILYLVINRIIKPLLGLSQQMAKVSQGDLNATFQVNSVGDDEIGILTKGFNDMLNNMQKLVHNIKNTTIKSKESADTISSFTEEIASSMEEISKAVETIASGTDNQASEVNESDKKMNILAKKIDNILNKLSVTNESTEEMVTKNQAGFDSINKLKNQFARNTDATLQAANGIEQVAAKSSSIKDIVTTINTIAEQTNLLALNASIEAARAGEHGRGFAVVAEEIRKLAEQSTKSVEEIGKIIEEIAHLISNTEVDMNKASDTVKQANQIMEDTEKVFEDLRTSVLVVKENANILNIDLQEIDKIKEEVLRSIESIALIAQETAASTEEVNASTQEQTATTEEMVAKIQELNKLLTELSNSVKIFKV